MLLYHAFLPTTPPLFPLFNQQFLEMLWKGDAIGTASPQQIFPSIINPARNSRSHRKNWIFDSIKYNSNPWIFSEEPCFMFIPPTISKAYQPLPTWKRNLYPKIQPNKAVITGGWESPPKMQQKFNLTNARGDWNDVRRGGWGWCGGCGLWGCKSHCLLCSLYSTNTPHPSTPLLYIRYIYLLKY